LLRAARWKSRTQKNHKKIAIWAPSHNFVGPYLRIDNRKKRVNQQCLPTCPRNMVNFGPLAAEICWRVWGTPAYFNGFCVLTTLLHGTLVVGVSETAALNRGRHLSSSAGRPSRWALAHISSSFFFTLPNLSRRRLDVYHTSTWCSPSAHLECRSEMYCTRLAGNAGPQNSPSEHHRTTLSGYIFATKARIDNRKNLLNSMSPPHMYSQNGELRPPSG